MIRPADLLSTSVAWRPLAPLVVLLAAFSSVAAQPDLDWLGRGQEVAAADSPDSPFEAVPGYGGQEAPTVAPTEPTTAEVTTTEPPRPTTTNPATAEMRAVQARLAELGYDIGPVDGVAGGRTAHTLMAFQKVEGLKRTGTVTPELREALASASRPHAMVAGAAPTRIEVDLNRQVLFHWRDGELVRILPVSSGNGEKYCVKGQCDVAVTPPGSFAIGRKAAGLEIAPLGELWWPMYFNGGIAIHGSPSVPGYPASHGCIRIPMYAAPTFYEQVARGTPVILVGRGPGPEGARAVPPPEPPPDPHPVVEPPVDELPATTSTLPAPATTAPEVPATTTTTRPSHPTTTTSTTTTLPFPPDLGWPGS